MMRIPILSLAIAACMAGLLVIAMPDESQAGSIYFDHTDTGDYMTTSLVGDSTIDYAGVPAEQMLMQFDESISPDPLDLWVDVVVAASSCTYMLGGEPLPEGGGDSPKDDGPGDDEPPAPKTPGLPGEDGPVPVGWC